MAAERKARSNAMKMEGEEKKEKKSQLNIKGNKKLIMITLRLEKPPR